MAVELAGASSALDVHELPDAGAVLAGLDCPQTGWHK